MTPQVGHLKCTKSIFKSCYINLLFSLLCFFANVQKQLKCDKVVLVPKFKVRLKSGINAFECIASIEVVCFERLRSDGHLCNCVMDFIPDLMKLFLS